MSSRWRADQGKKRPSSRSPETDGTAQKRLQTQAYDGSASRAHGSLIVQSRSRLSESHDIPNATYPSPLEPTTRSSSEKISIHRICDTNTRDQVTGASEHRLTSHTHTGNPAVLSRDQEPHASTDIDAPTQYAPAVSAETMEPGEIQSSPIFELLIEFAEQSATAAAFKTSFRQAQAQFTRASLEYDAMKPQFAAFPAIAEQKGAATSKARANVDSQQRLLDEEMAKHCTIAAKLSAILSRAIVPEAPRQAPSVSPANAPTRDMFIKLQTRLMHLEAKIESNKLAAEGDKKSLESVLHQLRSQVEHIDGDLKSLRTQCSTYLLRAGEDRLDEGKKDTVTMSEFNVLKDEVKTGSKIVTTLSSNVKGISDSRTEDSKALEQLRNEVQRAGGMTTKQLEGTQDQVSSIHAHLQTIDQRWLNAQAGLKDVTGRIDDTANRIEQIETTNRGVQAEWEAALAKGRSELQGLDTRLENVSVSLASLAQTSSAVLAARSIDVSSDKSIGSSHNTESNRTPTSGSPELYNKLDSRLTGVENRISLYDQENLKRDKEIGEYLSQGLSQIVDDLEKTKDLVDKLDVSYTTLSASVSAMESEKATQTKETSLPKSGESTLGFATFTPVLPGNPSKGSDSSTDPTALHPSNGASAEAENAVNLEREVHDIKTKIHMLQGVARQHGRMFDNLTTDTVVQQMLHQFSITYPEAKNFAAQIHHLHAQITKVKESLSQRFTSLNPEAMQFSIQSTSQELQQVQHNISDLSQKVNEHETRVQAGTQIVMNVQRQVREIGAEFQKMQVEVAQIIGRVRVLEAHAR